jgi:hypothetical protein
MKKKMRKFAEGGFSAAQEEWLGGADRTDPYILARMRSAVPDAPKDTYENNAPYKSDDQGLALSKEDVAAERTRRGYDDAPVTKTVTQSKVAVTKPKSTWEGNDKIPAMPDTPRKLETPAENKARMEELTKKQALINVEPENYLPGIGMVKGLLKTGAKKLLSRDMKTYTPAEMEAMVPKLGRERLKLGMKNGGSVKKMSSGGKVKSASSRADGCAVRGKTRA